MKKMLVALFALVFVLSLSSVAFSQEAMKKEMKKEETHALKSVSCAPDCGFMVRSHDESELMSIVKDHAKRAHHKDLTDADVKGMMKSDKMHEMRKEVKKETKKEMIEQK
jgi:predicted small metal-binding protein